MLGDNVVRLWRLFHTPQGRKLVRYSMVSVVSTAVSFGVLAIVYGIIRVGGEVSDTVFANVVAIFPSYYLNRSWVWGKSGKSHMWREVVPFWSMSVAGIVLSIFAADGAKHLGTTWHLHHLGRTVVLLIANVSAFGVLWILKFLLFNRLFHVHPVHDVIEELVEAQEHTSGS